jgi:hypothetical protein
MTENLPRLAKQRANNGRATRVGRRCGMAVLTLLIAGVGPVGADPITALYDIRISEAALVPDSGVTFQPQFTLSMTFDPADAPEIGNPFGIPSFSPVPLPRVPAPAVSRGTGFTEAKVDGAAALVAAGWEEVATGPGFFYGHTFWLTSSILGPTLATLPPLTAETFPIYLGTPSERPPFLFNFEYTSELVKIEGGVRDLQRYQFAGSATLREVQVGPDPVPEPATLVLLASGLAWVLRHRTRMRQPRRNPAPTISVR